MPGLTDTAVADILAAGRTPRAIRIDTYQRYHDGTIYEGRPGFFDEKSEAPLSERAPCVIFPGVPNAVRSYKTMCLGHRRFPTITSLTSEDDEAFDPRFGLDPDDSKTLDTVIGKICDQTRLPASSQQLLQTALHSGTAVPVLCIQKGKLVVGQVDPKCCEPEFDEEDPCQVNRLVVSYRYVVESWDPVERANTKKVYQYRRVIDDKFDTTFEPVLVPNKDSFPTPTVEKKKYRHGFGFCPVVWYKFLSPISAESDIDGKPLHWGLLPLCDAINFSLSQRHRAARYCGDPQIVETGVDDDDMRIPMGRASDARQQTADVSGWNMGLTQKRSGPMTMRKKGPGTVWRYVSPDAHVEMLTLPAEGLVATSEDAKDNIATLRESMGHVHLDPKDLAGSGDISGKTLAFLFKKQIDRCNEIREDFGRCCLLPILNMLFRIILKTGKGLYLAGADKARKILQRFEQKVGNDNAVVWFEPTLKLAWGDYFEPSDVDESTRIANAIAAHDGGAITMETLVGHIKPIFDDIGDVTAYLEALKKERQEKQAEVHDAMAAMNPPADENDDDGSGDTGGATGSAKTPRAQGGRPAPASRSAKPPNAPSRRPAAA